MRPTKYLLTALLSLLCLSVAAQSVDDKQLGTAVVTGAKREYIRLRGYYRSYQTNDSTLKYYRDGIVEYYVKCKDGDTDVEVVAERFLRDEQAFRGGLKKGFDLSDMMTARPLPAKKTLLETSDHKYTLAPNSLHDNILLGTARVGFIEKDSAADLTVMQVDLLAPLKEKRASLFGKTCTMTRFVQTERYKYDYVTESLKNLRSLSEEREFVFDYEKKQQTQRLRVVTELYVIEADYASKAEVKQFRNAIQNEINTPAAVALITPAQADVSPLDFSALWFYNPANLNKAWAQ